ncbi:hypothetical protein [Mesorhizobium sp. J428]|uniref:hypothetical protein n=1 Tax=Mesorhizobium sp. J428 TaxID=2898440 RepID=UPI0021514346|nr:hypothetical protein [Mesorhizobium sp. J428]MCR5858262.1 hypothetical protein [Mesorhizobium sp. J428]
MNYSFEQKEKDRVVEARESFSGRLLTDAQFDESIAITGIIEREIKKSGAFKEKLGDYAYAFARTEKIDAAKAETVLRDLFKARTGQTMNQMREELAEREEKLTQAQKGVAYNYAIAVGEMIERGDKISFARAYAQQGQRLAGELGITDAGAKRLIKEEFKAAENAEFYDWGKEMEEKFYRPQIEAEKQQREEQASERDGGRTRSSDRGGRFERKAASDENGSAPSRTRATQSRMQYRR